MRRVIRLTFVTLLGCREAPDSRVPLAAAGTTIDTSTAETTAGVLGGTASLYVPAVIESVRAYLHTLKLNEKDVAVGLTIPFAYVPPDGRGWIPIEPAPDVRVSNGMTYAGGSARATGRIGPKGHQVYEVRALTCDPSAQCFKQQKFIEISPEESPTR